MIVWIDYAKGQNYQSAQQAAQYLNDKLHSCGVTSVIVRGNEVSYARPELAVAVGGDGTVIRAMKRWSPEGVPVIGLANFPILKKYYLNTSNKASYVIENGKKKKIQVNSKASFSNMKMSAAFHGGLTLKQQSKIPQILKRMQFPCADALSYSHLCEGKIDVVIQGINKSLETQI